MNEPIKKYVIVNKHNHFLMHQIEKKKRTKADFETNKWIFQGDKEKACIFFSLEYANFMANNQEARVEVLQ